MKANAVIRIIVFALLIAVLLGILVVGVLVGTLGFASGSNPAIEGTNSSSGEADPSVVRDINIEWVAGDITIVPADTDVITFTESGSFDEKDTMVWKVSGDKLLIQYNKGNSFNISFFSFGTTTNISKDLMISVPRDWLCEELSIDCASANLEISDFTAKSIDFDGASGEGNFANCNVETLSIETVSGDIDYNGELTYLECDGVSARCELVLTNYPKSLTMDGVSGDLDVTLPADCGFSAQMDSVSGNISSEFSTTSENGRLVFGDGSCRIEADTTSGNIIIRKAA